MDLDDFSSSSVAAAATGRGKYGTPATILDGLSKAESGGNPYAVNAQTKAMGPYQFTPDTVAMLHKQGLKFDPFDPVQARDAADYYMAQLAKSNGGDYGKALTQYGGFVTKSPANYIAKVTGAPPPAGAPVAPSVPAQPGASSGYAPAIDDFSSKSISAAVPAPAPASAPSAAGDGMPPMPAAVHFPTSSIFHPSTWGISDFQKNMKPGSDPYADALYAKTGSDYYQRPGESIEEANQRTQMYDQKMRDAGLRQPADPLKMAASVVSGTVGSIAGGIRGLFQTGRSLVGGDNLSTAMIKGADAATSTQQAMTYVPGDPETRVQMGMASGAANPLNWPALGGDAVGSALGSAGYPGAGAAVATAGAALPMALGMKPVRSAIGKAATSARSSLADLTRPQAAPTPRVEPALEGPPNSPAMADASAKPSPAGATAAAPAVRGSVPAGTAPPEITPTDSLKSPNLSSSEQMARKRILQDVGFTTSRDSAITGDNRARAVEYQMSKFDEPAGQAAAQQFATEAQTMGDYARGLVQKAGGTLGTDQGSLYTRGQTIVRPIQALRDWFDDKARGLYQAADEKAQGQPVTLKGFGETLADPSQLTNGDRVSLQGAAAAFAKKAGMTVGEDGSLSGTALQAETVRKWLNQERTNANGRFVDALKDSLDDDVGQAAGGPIYDQARSLWQLRQRTLDDPKGISSLLDEEGTNRAVPFERVPDNVTKLPQDQFAHIVKTLQNLPPELQGVGNAALGEIKSQFFNKMLEGAAETRGGNARPFWNGSAVRNVIADNSGKLQALLSPEELAKIDTLKKAGDILSFDSSYPGAAAQAQNAVKRGLMSNLIGHATTAAGGAAGASLGFPGTGATLGRIVGERAQSGAAQRGALAKWNKGSVTLKELMQGTSPPSP